MLVRNKVGDGYVYTFTLWAYPGHEQFQKFTATWVEELACEAAEKDVYVIDDSREVFWTRWVDGDKTTVMLLNTDWTEKNNVKDVVLVADGYAYELQVTERKILIAEIENGEVNVEEYEL